MKGRTAAEAAEIEAFEEAGLRGTTAKKRVGTYHYMKAEQSGRTRDLKVDVFLLHVEREVEDWPERRERERAWFSPAEAAALVAKNGLERLIRRLPRLIMLDGIEREDRSGTWVQLADASAIEQDKA